MNPPHQDFLERVSESVWKIKADSNLFLLKLDEWICIDTGSRTNANVVENCVQELTSFDKVTKVLFTHLHYDHIGNFNLFSNAEFFASSNSIKDLEQDPFGVILNPDIIHDFQQMA